MADMTELKNIVRLGTVQSVNASKMTARVKFKDKGGITSGDLRIIKRPVYVVPAMESGAEGQTAKTTLKYDYNGQMLKEVSHNHEAFVTEWTPGVNDMVLCIMVPDGDGEEHIARALRRQLCGAARLKLELRLITSGDLAGKPLADAVDDALARSLAVLQAAGDGSSPEPIRVVVAPSEEELIS